MGSAGRGLWTRLTASGRLGDIEGRGIEPVPPSERTDRPAGVLWLWIGANIGVLGITMGAALVTVLGLSLWQAAAAAVLGAGASFAFVGLISLSGLIGAAPTMTLSRAVFGPRGNLGPVLVAWLMLLGWQTVLCVTGAFSFLSVVTVLDLPTPAALGGVVVVGMVAGSAGIGILGHTVLARLQKWLTWILAALTAVVVIILLATAHWTTVLAAPGGDLVAVISAVGYVAVGTGVHWLAVGADYTRYQADGTGRAVKVLRKVVLGGAVPVIVLVFSGAVVAAGGQGIAGDEDPVAAVGSLLPDWLLVPYLVVAMLGLMAAANLTARSSGLTLLAGGVRLPRWVAVLIGSVLVALIGIYLTAVEVDRLDSFAALVTALALPMAAWAGIFVVDLITRRHYDADGLTDAGPGGPYWYWRGFHLSAVGTWLLAIGIGLLCTRIRVGTETWFAGPFADTWLGNSSLGWLVAGVTATAIYWVLEPLNGSTHNPCRAK